MRIINLTQHLATPEQIAQGVFEPNDKGRVRELLTFNELPTMADIDKRAMALLDVAVAEGATHAMVGGAPYLMSTLEFCLSVDGIEPLYSFSKRVSVEVMNPDGTVTKTNVFKHVGFVGLDNNDEEEEANE